MTKEYVPIQFDKASEAVAYLEDGGKLYQMDAGHTYQVYIPTVASNWPVTRLYTEKKPAPWYERLDNDVVLCWVSSYEKSNPSDGVIERIEHWSVDNGFYGVSGYWKYATPLTSEEVEKILATHKRLGL